MIYKIDHVCCRCGSNSITVKGECTWDIEQQKFVFYDTYDSESYCYNCNEYTAFKDVKVLHKDVKDLLAELDISIACMLDNAMDVETEKDIEHIQNTFLKLEDLLRDNSGDIYVK